MTTARTFRLVSAVSCLFLLKYLSLSFDVYPDFIKDPQKLDFFKKISVMIYQMIPFILIVGMIGEINKQRFIRYKDRLVFWYSHVGVIVLYFSLFLGGSYLFSGLNGDFGKVYFGNLTLLPLFLIVDSLWGMGFSLGLVVVLLSLALNVKMGDFSFLSLQLRTTTGFLPALIMAFGILTLFYLLYRKEILDD